MAKKKVQIVEEVVGASGAKYGKDSEGNIRRINKSGIPGGILKGVSLAKAKDDIGEVRGSGSVSNVEYVSHVRKPTSGYRRNVQKVLSLKGTVREMDIIDMKGGQKAPAQKIINVYYDSMREYEPDKQYTVDKERIRNSGTVTDESGRRLYFPSFARWRADELTERALMGRGRAGVPPEKSKEIAQAARDTEFIRHMKGYKSQGKWNREQEKLIQEYLNRAYPGTSPTKEHVIKTAARRGKKVKTAAKRNRTQKQKKTTAKRSRR